MKAKTESSRSEIPEAIRALSEKNRQLQALVYDLKEFTAMVTHDLRAPLAAMKGFAQMLSELYSSSLDQRGRHLVDRIMFNATHMDSVIRGLRELVLVGEEGRSRVRIEPNMIIKTVMENRSGQISQKDIRVEPAPALPVLVADPAKIFLVFDNLLSNSFKYASEVAQPVVRIGGGRVGEEFVWYVEDNGPGVAPEFRKKIFEVFFQCDKDLPGLGLGLSIVRRVVQLHNGEIWVEQGQMGGAKFCFTLPDAMSPLS